VVFITVSVRETQDGPEMEASIGWAAKILAEKDVRAFAEAWFQMLRRFVEFHASFHLAQRLIHHQDYLERRIPHE
jgi:hypothetical protein